MFLHNTIHTNEMETELPATGRLFPVSSIIIMEKNEHEFNAEKRDDHKIPSKQQKLYLSTIVVCITIQNPFLFTTRKEKLVMLDLDSFGFYLAILNENIVFYILVVHNFILWIYIWIGHLTMAYEKSLVRKYTTTFESCVVYLQTHLKNGRTV